jgi:hypothetical protein
MAEYQGRIFLLHVPIPMEVEGLVIMCAFAWFRRQVLTSGKWWEGR